MHNKRFRRFRNLLLVAQAQNCVLQSESRGYSLYSNTSFVGANCATLDEVAQTLAFDPGFGAPDMSTPEFCYNPGE